MKTNPMITKIEWFVSFLLPPLHPSHVQAHISWIWNESFFFKWSFSALLILCDTSVKHTLFRLTLEELTYLPPLRAVMSRLLNFVQPFRVGNVQLIVRHASYPSVQLTSSKFCCCPLYSMFSIAWLLLLFEAMLLCIKGLLTFSNLESFSWFP